MIWHVLHVDVRDLKVMAVPRPNISLEQVIPLASKLFSFQSSNLAVVKELESYDDRNFLLKGQIRADKQATHETAYVFKVLNLEASQKIGILTLISKVLLFLNVRGVQCPVPQLSISGKYIVWYRFPKEGRCEKAAEWKSKEEETLDGTELVSYERCIHNASDSRSLPESNLDDDNTVVYAIQLFTFLPGKLLGDLKFNADLIYNFGLEIGKLHKVLKEFSQTSDFYDTHLEASENHWHLPNSPASIIQYCHAVEDKARRTRVQEIAQRFQNEFLPKLKQLDTQVIHGDLNPHNIIVEQNPDEQFKIKGFIDFSDLYVSYRVLDVGIAVAYLMMASMEQGMSIIDVSRHVIRGYQSVFPLSSLEVDIILEATKTRISHSLVMGIHNYKYVSPDNEYLLYWNECGWKVLDEILQIPQQDIVSAWLSS